MSGDSDNVMYIVPSLVIFAVTTVCCVILTILLCYGKFGCPCCCTKYFRERRRRKALTNNCQKGHYGKNLLLSSNERCPVCLEDFRDNEMVLLTPCSHALHEDCLFRCLERCHLCPLCKTLIVQPESATPLIPP